MGLFTIITILVVITALFSYWNARYLKLPETIGLTVISLAYSILIIAAGNLFPTLTQMERTFVAQIDFSGVLLNVMLCFLLFAGAFHTNVELLRRHLRSITVFAVIGVLVSTAVIGGILFGVFQLLHVPVPLLHCFLFGALISPTDPIAVLGILSRSGIPKDAEINIVGESLFNDGVGVVLFAVLTGIAQHGVSDHLATEVLVHLLREAGGGLLLGWALGMAGYWMMRKIDHYQAEVMITLAIAMGGYELASWLGVSGPLAMVLAGLITGNRSRQSAMSHQTAEYVEKFWVLIDSLMNALLFVLIGLEMVVIDFSSESIWAGILAIPVVLFARWFSIWLPYILAGRMIPSVDGRMIRLMTWGGLRGGLSIAMALSLKAPVPRDVFVVMVFLVMAFSIIAQGLTVGRLAGKLYALDSAKTS